MEFGKKLPELARPDVERPSEHEVPHDAPAPRAPVVVPDTFVVEGPRAPLIIARASLGDVTRSLDEVTNAHAQRTQDLNTPLKPTKRSAEESIALARQEWQGLGVVDSHVEQVEAHARSLDELEANMQSVLENLDSRTALIDSLRRGQEVLQTVGATSQTQARQLEDVSAQLNDVSGKKKTARETIEANKVLLAQNRSAIEEQMRALEALLPGQDHDAQISRFNAISRDTPGLAQRRAAARANVERLVKEEASYGFFGKLFNGTAYNNIVTSLKQARADLVGLNTRFDERERLRGKIEEWENKHQEGSKPIHAQLQKLDAERLKLEGANRDLTAQVSNLERQEQSLSSQKQELENQIKARSTLGGQSQDLAAIATRLERLGQEQNSLRSMRPEIETSVSQVQAQIKAAKALAQKAVVNLRSERDSRQERLFRLLGTTHAEAFKGQLGSDKEKGQLSSHLQSGERIVKAKQAVEEEELAQNRQAAKQELQSRLDELKATRALEERRAQEQATQRLEAAQRSRQEQASLISSLRSNLTDELKAELGKLAMLKPKELDELRKPLSGDALKTFNAKVTLAQQLQREKREAIAQAAAERLGDSGGKLLAELQKKPKLKPVQDRIRVEEQQAAAKLLKQPRLEQAQSSVPVVVDVPKPVLDPSRMISGQREALALEDTKLASLKSRLSEVKKGLFTNAARDEIASLTKQIADLGQHIETNRATTLNAIRAQEQEYQTWSSNSRLVVSAGSTSTSALNTALSGLSASSGRLDLQTESGRTIYKALMAALESGSGKVRIGGEDLSAAQAREKLLKLGYGAVADASVRQADLGLRIKTLEAQIKAGEGGPDAQSQLSAMQNEKASVDRNLAQLGQMNLRSAFKPVGARDWGKNSTFSVGAMDFSKGKGVNAPTFDTSDSGATFDLQSATGRRNFTALFDALSKVKAAGGKVTITIDGTSMNAAKAREVLREKAVSAYLELGNRYLASRKELLALQKHLSENTLPIALDLRSRVTSGSLSEQRAAELSRAQATVRIAQLESEMALQEPGISELATQLLHPEMLKAWSVNKKGNLAMTDLELKAKYSKLGVELYSPNTLKEALSAAKIADDKARVAKAKARGESAKLKIAGLESQINPLLADIKRLSTELTTETNVQKRAELTEQIATKKRQVSSLRDAQQAEWVETRASVLSRDLATVPGLSAALKPDGMTSEDFGWLQNNLNFKQINESLQTELTHRDSLNNWVSTLEDPDFLAQFSDADDLKYIASMAAQVKQARAASNKMIAAFEDATGVQMSRQNYRNGIPPEAEFQMAVKTPQERADVMTRYGQVFASDTFQSELPSAFRGLMLGAGDWDAFLVKNKAKLDNYFKLAAQKPFARDVADNSKRLIYNPVQMRAGRYALYFNTALKDASKTLISDETRANVRQIPDEMQHRAVLASGPKELAALQLKIAADKKAGKNTQVDDARALKLAQDIQTSRTFIDELEE